MKVTVTAKSQDIRVKASRKGSKVVIPEQYLYILCYTKSTLLDPTVRTPYKR